MDRLFITVLNMSITASCVFAVILLLRLIMQKLHGPRWMVCVLWAALFFRLLCPVTFTSEYSLFQFLPQYTNQIEAGAQMEYIAPSVYAQQLPNAELHKPFAEEAVAEQTVVYQDSATTHDTNRASSIMTYLPILWFLGVLLFTGYSVWQWVQFRRKIATATFTADHVYESDRIHGAFVMGLLRPNIYLPLGLEGEVREAVLLHERSHIKRGDLWWKAIAHVALILHWFNPLMYGAYYLFEQDLEQACDEKVLKKLGSDYKVDYSTTLLAMSTGSYQLWTPLAFGESKTKQRVKNILQYSKPAVSVAVICLVIGTMTAISCMSNPLKFSTEHEIYSQASRQSVFYASHWIVANPNLEEIYRILLPDDPLKQQQICYHPRGMLYQMKDGVRLDCLLNAEERSGVFQFDTEDYQQFQQHLPEMKQYMQVVMALAQLEKTTASIGRYIDDNSSISESLYDEVTIEFIPQNQQELQKLLEHLKFAGAEEKAAQLWPFAETMRAQEQLMQRVQEAYPFYDMMSGGVVSFNYNRPEQGNYYIEYFVDERDTYLRERVKDRMDYKKSAILLFAQYPQLAEVEMHFVGAALSWGVAYRADTLHFSRKELEQQCGTLRFSDEASMESQVQTWFEKAERHEVVDPYGQPQMDFTEKLRRLEWYYDHEKTASYWEQNESYSQLRFSLLPGQVPENGGCYLQMEFLEPVNHAQEWKTTSSIWIYGKEAQWQEITALRDVTDENGKRKIYCSGKYRIVVSRWDTQLRSALETLGGQLTDECPSLWTVVYEGTLNFLQEL